jgi:hypothetical protein
MISVRTSQETYYVLDTKSSRLMLLGKQSLFIVRTIRNTEITLYVKHAAFLNFKVGGTYSNHCSL